MRAMIRAFKNWMRAKHLRKNAGIAQLVERNLAKVEVDGSRPFSRSTIYGLQTFVDICRFMKKGASAPFFMPRNCPLREELGYLYALSALHISALWAKNFHRKIQKTSELGRNAAVGRIQHVHGPRRGCVVGQ